MLQEELQAIWANWGTELKIAKLKLALNGLILKYMLSSTGTDWEKYMLSSTCLAQICLCAKIFSVRSALMDDCTENFGAHWVQMDNCAENFGAHWEQRVLAPKVLAHAQLKQVY